MDGKTSKKAMAVVLAGRPYSLMINSADELVITRLVKEINQKIQQFDNKYPHRDIQDFLAMTLLTYAVELLKARSSSPSNSYRQYSNSLREIDQMLDEILDDSSIEK